MRAIGFGIVVVVLGGLFEPPAQARAKGDLDVGHIKAKSIEVNGELIVRSQFDEDGHVVARIGEGSIDVWFEPAKRREDGLPQSVTRMNSIGFQSIRYRKGPKPDEFVSQVSYLGSEALVISENPRRGAPRAVHIELDPEGAMLRMSGDTSDDRVTISTKEKPNHKRGVGVFVSGDDDIDGNRKVTELTGEGVRTKK